MSSGDSCWAGVCLLRLSRGLMVGFLPAKDGVADGVAFAVGWRWLVCVGNDSVHIMFGLMQANSGT